MTPVECHVNGDIAHSKKEWEEAVRLWGMGAMMGHEQCLRNLVWHYDSVQADSIQYMIWKDLLDIHLEGTL
jgi:hypothetical protein